MPKHTHKWKIECIYFFFFPIPYKTAPIVYTIPPDNNKIKPGMPNNDGNRLALIIMHHPITKGDNNNNQDSGYVLSQQIEGKYEFKIARLGNLAMFIQTPLGMIVCLSIPILILLIFQITDLKKDKDLTVCPSPISSIFSSNWAKVKFSEVCVSPLFLNEYLIGL